MKVTAFSLIIVFISANLLSLQTLPNPLSAAATKVLVKTGVKQVIRIPFLSDGISYLIDPDTTTIQGSMQEWMDMSGVQSLGSCDSIRCSQFVSSCAVKLGLPKSTDARVVFLSHESSRCVDDFFNLPLETQSEQRSDSNLDRLLSSFAPNIRNLTCLNNHTELKVAGANKTEALYKITFNSTGQIEKVFSEEGLAKTQLLFNAKGAPQLLQICDVENGCRNFTMNDVETRKLYLWRNEKEMKNILGPTKLNFSKKNNLAIADTPTEAFKWARQSLPLVRKQGQLISNCCQPASGGNNACLAYFAKRAKSNEVAKRSSIIQANKIAHVK